MYTVQLQFSLATMVKIGFYTNFMNFSFFQNINTIWASTVNAFVKAALKVQVKIESLTGVGGKLFFGLTWDGGWGIFQRSLADILNPVFGGLCLYKI